MTDRETDVWVLGPRVVADNEAALLARLSGPETWSGVNARLAAGPAADRLVAVPLTDPSVRRGARALIGLLGPALLVLLVACGNALGRSCRARAASRARVGDPIESWRHALAGGPPGVRRIGGRRRRRWGCGRSPCGRRGPRPSRGPHAGQRGRGEADRPRHARDGLCARHRGRHGVPDRHSPGHSRGASRHRVDVTECTAPDDLAAGCVRRRGPAGTRPDGTRGCARRRHAVVPIRSSARSPAANRRARSTRSACGEWLLRLGRTSSLPPRAVY